MLTEVEDVARRTAEVNEKIEEHRIELGRLNQAVNYY